MKLTDVNVEDVRMTAIGERTVKVLLQDDIELEFVFESSEQLSEELARWKPPAKTYNFRQPESLS